MSRHLSIYQDIKSIGLFSSFSHLIKKLLLLSTKMFLCLVLGRVNIHCCLYLELGLLEVSGPASYWLA